MQQQFNLGSTAQKRGVRTIMALGIAALGVAAATAPVQANSIWVDWQSGGPWGILGGFGSGVINTGGQTVNVSYGGPDGYGSGRVFAQEQWGTHTNPFPQSQYFYSSAVQEAPGDSQNQNFDSVYFLLWGSTTRNNRVVFSQPVTNPIIALHGFGTTREISPGSFAFTNWVFDRDFTILSSNDGVAGSIFTRSQANVLAGNEGTGVIMFEGTFSSISWTWESNVFDGLNEHSMQVGVLGNAIPAPAALSLLSLGLGFSARGRRR